MSVYALKRLRLDEVWWLVSPQNPLKPVRGMAPLHERVTKAEEIARHPRIRVTAIESKLGTIYTADTLKALKHLHPRMRFVWLMGADNLRQIAHWKRWQDIFETVPVAVFRRAPYAAGRGAGKAAQRFNYAWLPAAASLHLADYPPPAWLVLDNPLNTLSATEIRKDHTTWPPAKKR